MDRLVDIKELSRILSIPIGSIYNLVSQKRIPFVRIGRRIRFNRNDISRWVRDLSQEAETEYNLQK